jgi:hypothetical protein
LKLVAGAVMASLSCCTPKHLKSKPRIIVLDGIAIVKRESIMHCTRFKPRLRNPRMILVIMVNNFNGLQQDFDVLILECFESGINAWINTVCA